MRRAGGASLQWQTIATFAAAGTTTEAQSYTFTDENVPYEAERVVYCLRQVDLDGTATYSDVVEVALGAPQQFTLHAAFPNPFSRATTIRYALPAAARVHLDVFNMLGRRVRVLVDEKQEAGRQEIRFEASGLASGVYFVRLAAGEHVATRRLVVVR